VVAVSFSVTKKRKGYAFIHDIDLRE
jgi:hypothetical protein